MDVQSNRRKSPQSACNKRKRKATSSNSPDRIKPSKKPFVEDSSSDHYSSSPITTPPSISNILSPPEIASKQDPNGTSRTPGVSYDTNVSCFTPLSGIRPCPLPALAWANSTDVWELMCKKDEREALKRNPEMLAYHPGLQPRMRAILLDWLIEVCDVYKLHRETYYLAVDYLDRFLSAKTESSKTPKTRLQLIGITCLFLAAKVEEIYPPKINEFAYVTDGACEESDIVHQEQMLLHTLEWKAISTTIINWLGIYMQLYANNRTPNTLRKHSTQIDDGFLYPQFPGSDFARAARLLDLCTLDVEMANFSYSVLAASAFAYTVNKSIALEVSGLEWNIMEPCYRWMQPFYDVVYHSSDLFLLERNEPVKLTSECHYICPTINTDDSHTIQTHTTSLDMLDKVIVQKQKYELVYEKTVRQEASPAQITVLTCPEGLLTPPDSIRKSTENITHPKILYQ